MRRPDWSLHILVAVAALVLSCVEIPTGEDDLLSFQFDPLPSPSVVAGDTLRDSTGAAAPLSITAFNFDGTIVTSPGVRFRPLDTRARVDSITGVVVGDSAGSTARIVAAVDDVTGLISLPVILWPDTIVGSNARDTLLYSLSDTASNVSDGMGVRVLHGPAAGDSAVTSFRVTFELLAPTDTALARLVDEGGRRSSADTTDASGIATRRVRIDVARLTAVNDSVIVQANVKYRGTHVRGSPMRLLLELKPR